MKAKLLLLILMACWLAGCATPQEHYDLAQDILQEDNLSARQYAQATYHLQQAANAGNASACYELAYVWLEQDMDSVPNREQFIHWLQKAAELGLPQAQFELGVYQIHASKTSSGLKWLEQAALSGDPEWQLKLSQFYCCSSYVPQSNFNRSFYWAMEAAKQGLPAAQSHVGYFYSIGQGVAKSYENAFYWTEQAAQAGDPYARNDLAICYEYGLGTEVDYAKAIYWYERAIEDGLADAYTNLAVLYVYTAPKPYYNPKQGFALLQQAVEQEQARAMSVMAECYQFGVGVKRDLERAYFWQNKAHEMGYDVASYYLGRMYLEGVGVKQDTKQAYLLFLQAAEKENWGGASCQLGDIFLNGSLESKGKNYELALLWYTRAARQGNQRAMYQLGQMYENGLGVAKNLYTALGWYEKALNLSKLELRASYTEQSLSQTDPVAATSKLAQRAAGRLKQLITK